MAGWYSWGSGGGGCLVHKDFDDYYVPVAMIPNQIPSSFTSISCGGCHCIVAQDDDVSCWGDNTHGQCGQIPSDIISIPSPVVLPKPVIQVACGWRHSLLLLNDGGVVSFGHKSMVGRPVDLTPSHEPGYITVQPEQRFTFISCGYQHSAIINRDGSVWLWGNNKFGQLGQPSSKQPLERAVRSDSFLRFAIGIACGLRHTAVLANSGEILTAGSNGFGQLGRHVDDKYSSKWGPIETAMSSISLQCGWSHCLALSASGHVLSWGRGDFGQQGDGSWDHHHIPHDVNLPTPISSIYCGSEHSLCFSINNGSLWAFGWNEHGNLGIGDQINRSIPTRVFPSATTFPAIVTGGAACLAIISNIS
uniref:RCC1-like domain-containing protein n=1 Tax=Spongospora subterranea TaxID=70186 RepID=A0A0H5QGV8_9EUKA|eukprot:CRZ01215.1 hypothetical protein [Spongospora subterranea]